MHFVRERRVQLGGLQVAVRIDDALSARLRETRTYQWLRPAVSALRNQAGGAERAAESRRSS